MAVPLTRNAFAEKRPYLLVVFSKISENVLFSFFLHKNTNRYSHRKIFAVLGIILRLQNRPGNWIFRKRSSSSHNHFIIIIIIFIATAWNSDILKKGWSTCQIRYGTFVVYSQQKRSSVKKGRNFICKNLLQSRNYIFIALIVAQYLTVFFNCVTK